MRTQNWQSINSCGSTCTICATTAAAAVRHWRPMLWYCKDVDLHRALDLCMRFDSTVVLSVGTTIKEVSLESV